MTWKAFALDTFGSNHEKPQDNQDPDGDVNRAHPEHKSEALSLDTTCSAKLRAAMILLVFCETRYAYRRPSRANGAEYPFIRSVSQRYVVS
jgi:hypothetical protein